MGRGAKRPWVAPFLEKLYVFYFSPLNSLLLSTDVNHFGKTTYVFIFCVTLSVCVCNCLCMIFSETQGVTSRHTTWTSPLKWVVQFLLLSSHMRVVWFFSTNQNVTFLLYNCVSFHWKAVSFLKFSLSHLALLVWCFFVLICLTISLMKYDRKQYLQNWGM